MATTKNFSLLYPSFDLQGTIIKRAAGSSKAKTPLISRNKGANSSLHLTQPKLNGCSLLSRQMALCQRKKLRNSKSCVKGVHVKSQNGVSFSPSAVTNQSWLRAVYDPQQTSLYKTCLLYTSPSPRD
eukprot:TRINITY_DN12272_c0_g2_i15.p1 TRINITY_DN12272_c0_g2~~TRINITY_DN12272_c0_g2_i15.p1  ORF type:complete len:127 (-),score=26.87 TRINITY_DN12272_c0_g2_i15:77-457(-)